MKKMTSKHDFHTFPTEKGIFVSIHQEDELREDLGPFNSQRVANNAAHNEWRQQQESNAARDEKLKNLLIEKGGINPEWAKSHLIIDSSPPLF
jgi:hypothetical protein